MSSVLAQAHRLVIKVGSSLVTNQGLGLDHEALAKWAEQIAELKRREREVLLVSSGAIAEGMQRLGWKRRPRQLHHLPLGVDHLRLRLLQAALVRIDLRGDHVQLTLEDLALLCDACHVGNDPIQRGLGGGQFRFGIRANGYCHPQSGADNEEGDEGRRRPQWYA